MSIKPNCISIFPKGKVGMSGGENNEVLAILRRARARGELPSLTFEYNKHPRIFGKDPLYIYVKGASLGRTGVKIRTILRKAFGSKFLVRLN